MKDNYQGECESSKQAEGDIFDPTLEAKHRGETRQKSSRSDIMKQAMESRGLGKFVGKHELHVPANDREADSTQGDDEDFMTWEVDQEVKGQKENLGPGVEFDQCPSATPDQSLGGESISASNSPKISPCTSPETQSLVFSQEHVNRKYLRPALDNLKSEIVDDKRPTHSAIPSSSASSRCPKHKGIIEPTAKPHGLNVIKEAIHKASTRRLRTSRFDGRYTGRCRRFRTTTPSNILQVRNFASNDPITTVTIINKKVQQGLQRTQPRIRSSPSNPITSETAMFTKDSALHLMALQLSEPSDPRMAIHSSLQGWPASLPTECTLNARLSPTAELQVRSLLNLMQRSTAQGLMDTHVKRPSGAGLEHLLDLRPPNVISPQLNDVPFATSAEEQGARTQFSSGRQLPRLWTSCPPSHDLSFKTVQPKHNITNNADNDQDPDHRVMAPNGAVSKEDVEMMRAPAFDNDAAPDFQAMVIYFPGHRASDRLIKATTAKCASQPLETALLKIDLIRHRRNLNSMIKRGAFEGYMVLDGINALSFKFQADLVQSHVVFNLPQAMQSECLIHHITNSVYLMILVSHNKACLLLILSVVSGTGRKVQGWVSLHVRCLESLSRQQDMTLHPDVQWSVPFYDSVPRFK